MTLARKILFVFSNLLITLPATVWAVDDEYHAPDYDDLIPGISANTGRIYNLIPSHGRDSFAWAHTNESPKLFSVSREELPASFNLNKKVHHIHNQLKLGSCTGQALTQSMEMQLIGDAYRPLSPLFVYYNERRMEGTIEKDSGASITDGIQMTAQYGACSEQLWPYDDYLNTFKNEPSTACYEDALKSVVLNYTHVTEGIEAIKSAIFSGSAVVGGIAVFESFESPEADETGVIPMPKRGEKLLGGHAITFMGYNDEDQTLDFVNSWGTTWGKKGFGKLPYKYASNPKLAMPTEFWAVNKVGPKEND